MRMPLSPGGLADTRLTGREWTGTKPDIVWVWDRLQSTHVGGRAISPVARRPTSHARARSHPKRRYRVVARAAPVPSPAPPT